MGHYRHITKELTCTVFPFAYACGCVVSRVERGGGEWGWRGVLHIAPCAHRRYPPVHIDGAPLGTWTVHPVHMDSASYVDSSPCAHGKCTLRTWTVPPAHIDGAPCAHGQCPLRTWTVHPVHIDSAPCARTWTVHRPCPSSAGTPAPRRTCPVHRALWRGKCPESPAPGHC